MSKPAKKAAKATKRPQKATHRIVSSGVAAERKRGHAAIGEVIAPAKRRR